ncbi:MAG: cation transporter [Actinobacteria bacterium ATB1]|nr:cation transporter [Actinobacteria bacterium ATB1]
MTDPSSRSRTATDRDEPFSGIPPTPIVLLGVRATFHTMLLLSLWFLLRGHNVPGGGFIGGLVAAIALVLRWVALGRPRQRFPGPSPVPTLGLGLTISAVTAAAPLVVSDQILESRLWSWQVPLLGSVKLSSTLFFDTGVYLVVVGLALVALATLGRDDVSGEPT